MKRLFGAALLALSSLVVNAEDCDWLPVEKIDQAFPQQAPWQTMVGGKIGRCKFLSNPAEPASIFGVNQMVEASVAEAEKTARSLKTETAKSYAVQAAPALGKEGFTYAPNDDARSLFFVGQRKNVVVMGSLVMQQAVAPSQREAAERLLQVALGLADDAGAIAAATHCPYFDDALLHRLLPGKDFSQNVLGATSCLAQAEGKAVILAITDNADERLMQRMSGTDCTTEPLAQIGKTATLAHQCKSGSPRAEVRYLVGDRLFSFTLSQEREPSVADRALLIELAAHAAKR